MEKVEPKYREGFPMLEPGPGGGDREKHPQ